MNKILLSITLFFVLSSIALSAYKHRLIASTLIKHSNYIEIEKDIFVSPETSEIQKKELLRLIQEAKNRINKKFGSYSALPIIISSQNKSKPRPYSNNSYGSTDFTLNKAYIVLGKNGHNLDVVSHELIHAELFQRVGYFNRWLEIPVWFDEGAAMQVDFRKKYMITPENKESIKKLKTGRQFFAGNLTAHYSLAKYEVETWLKSYGNEAFYKLLNEVKNEKTFEESY